MENFHMVMKIIPAKTESYIKLSLFPVFTSFTVYIYLNEKCWAHLPINLYISKPKEIYLWWVSYPPPPLARALIPLHYYFFKVSLSQI